MEQRDNSHKAWAGDKKPSMKRRCEENDYTERGLYMVTLAIEGRQPLLGQLAGNAAINEGPDSPHVVLSPFGEQVKACWLAIQQYNPQIEPIKLCIMPDHIHGILFVHEKIERHLGHVINGFKAGTRKAARNLGVITAALPQPTEQLHTSPVLYAEASPQPNKTKHPSNGLIWEPNYNDRILLRKGQLQRWMAYLDDNPRRLLLKRQHLEYFTQLSPIPILDTMMPAMGNRFLLERPIKLQVQCSRHLYQNEIEERKQYFLKAGAEGAVIVSPCISRGEQQIATACIEAHIPFIVLLVGGFPPYYKPTPLYLQACAEGRLLLLSPFQWQNEKITNMRQRCLYLNELAKRICEEANKKG